tara:strand:- start:1683 stop:2555 length:873 start_codon:yes stop_codon:yes gene_type:complete
MEITFWGVRGSFPVSSPHCARYGGNTPCIEVNAQDTCVIIDAGTGIYSLGKRLVERGQKEIHLLISHTHWDHIHGFPHFAPLRESDVTVHLYSLANAHYSLKDILYGQQQEPFFPDPLDAVDADLHFTDLYEGQLWNTGTIEVQCRRLNHASYTSGFRLESAGKTFSYVSDTDLYGPRLHGEGMNTGSEDEKNQKRIELQKSALKLAQDTDLLVFDSFFLTNEYKDDWGHSKMEDAIRLGIEANARRIAFFHHAPSRSDDQLDELVMHYSAEVNRGTNLVAAAEGDHFVL